MVKVKIAEQDGCPNERVAWHKQQGQCARCAIVCREQFRQAKPAARAAMLVADRRKHQASSSK